MKKRFFIPMAMVISILMAVPAFAQHIYIGDTETVVSYDENGSPVITLIFDPAKTPDYMKPDSPNYWQKAEQTGQGADFTAQPEKETSGTPFQPNPPLTEAPEVGTVPANIQQADENGELRFTAPYDGYSIGQCTWYARGRFREVYGIELPFFGNARIWAEKAAKYPELNVVFDLADVPEQSIAVYRPTGKFRDWPGHVRFVEYVERDENWKPMMVYYTDANGVGDPEKGVYNPGYDGSVKAVSYEDFIAPYGSTLAGYILPKER